MGTAITTSQVAANRSWSGFRPFPQATSLALLMLRVIIGVVFIGHGGQKLFGLWGGHGIQGFAPAVAHLGFPLPLVFGYVAAIAEFGGGIALIVGLFTRLAALGLVVDMLVAIVGVHLANGLLGHGPGKPGFDFPLVCLAGFVLLLLMGAGEYSADYLLARSVQGMDVRQNGG